MHCAYEQSLLLCKQASKPFRNFIAEYASLDELQELLNPAHFFWGNRQYLIHIHTIDRIRSTYKGLSVHLKAPLYLEIDISREKAAACKEWISE